ncbi:hypothetical protein D3C81_2020470 [compost metagenome]
MITKTIPLKAVSDALMMAALKASRARANPAGTPQKRSAAFTDQPSSLAPRCANKRSRITLEPVHCGFMGQGDLDRVVSRVHLEHGTREVRRIWGIGLRDMHAEIDGGLR